MVFIADFPFLPCATDPKNKALEEFQSLSPSPFLPFLPLQGLVGEKYGSIRVPGEVESAEFEMILDAAVEAGLDTHILEEWYCRDENSVPPAYYLKPKAQMLKNYQNSVSPVNMLPLQGREHTFHGALFVHSSIFSSNFLLVTLIEVMKSA